MLKFARFNEEKKMKMDLVYLLHIHFVGKPGRLGLFTAADRSCFAALLRHIVGIDFGFLPSHFQLGFLGAGHLAYRSALGIDGKGALFRSGIVILKLDGHGVFAHILGALGVHQVIFASGVTPGRFSLPS